MGLTKVTTTLSSLEAPGSTYQKVFLVDAGASDSIVPRDALRGVTEVGKMSYELADGTVKELAYGLVRIEFMGEVTAGRVIFADPGIETILDRQATSSHSAEVISKVNTRRLVRL